MKLILALLVVAIPFALSPSSQADSPIPALSKAGPAGPACGLSDFSTNMNCYMRFAVKSVVFEEESYEPEVRASKLFVNGTKGEKVKIRAKFDGIRALEGCREMAAAAVAEPNKRFAIYVEYSPDVWERVKSIHKGRSVSIQLYHPQSDHVKWSPVTLNCEVHAAGSAASFSN